MHKKYLFLVAALALVLLPTFNLAFCQDATSQQDKPAASGSNFAAQGDDDQAQTRSRHQTAQGERAIAEEVDCRGQHAADGRGG